jgi:hypothetical protein
MESKIKMTRRTWKDLEKTALDRWGWKDVVVDLCLKGAKGEEALSKKKFIERCTIPNHIEE